MIKLLLVILSSSKSYATPDNSQYIKCCSYEVLLQCHHHQFYYYSCQVFVVNDSPSSSDSTCNDHKTHCNHEINYLYYPYMVILIMLIPYSYVYIYLTNKNFHQCVLCVASYYANKQFNFINIYSNNCEMNIQHCS